MESSNSILYTTATILNWHHLLEKDEFKDILISCLQTLTHEHRLTVFAFVIMPNHLHIIWSENKNTLKETEYASFFKFTAHQLLRKMKKEKYPLHNSFFVDKADRKYQVWQRNILNIEVYSENVFDQKLEYIHNNPMQLKWKLVDDASKYRYSSAAFYKHGIDAFGILTDYYLF